ncbi:MAG: bile acid:sodium symporter family protein, partial [Atopobiaceae bacterium]|nr:bile acid:sodium symporter family protein [Atopobiaceae bacterium]
GQRENRIAEAWQGLGRWIGTHLMVVVPTGVAIGILFPQLLLPIKPYIPGLFAIMTFQNSLGNEVGAMEKTLARPLPLALILLTVHVAMPLVTFGASTLVFGAGSPTVAGVVLEYSVPIGASTVMWIGMFAGDLALGLSALLVSTLAAPFTIPLTLKLLVGKTVEIDALGMIADMLFMIALPALAATVLNELSHGWAKRDLQPATMPVSRILLPVIVATNATGIADYLHDLSLRLVGIIAFMLVFAILSLVVGMLLARLLSKTRAHYVATAFSCGIRNVSAGAVLASQYFGPEVMFPAVIGTLFQQFLAALFGQLMQRTLERSSLR